MKDLSEIYITDENRKWIEVLSKHNLKEFKIFLKKEKEQLPPKYKFLHKDTDKRIADFMYTLILHAPGLTHLKTHARNYFRHNNFGSLLSGKTCSDCKWLYRAPLTEDNPELLKNGRGLSCEKLGSLPSDIACEGYLNREGKNSE